MNKFLAPDLAHILGGGGMQVIEDNTDYGANMVLNVMAIFWSTETIIHM